MTSPLRGVYAPVLTPFNDQLEPDVERFIDHARWLVDNQAGLAIFGTNSEAASLSVDRRPGHAQNVPLPLPLHR